jgi:hypothetical protein
MTPPQDGDLDACYKVLELPPGAPLAAVQKAYLRLKKLYTGDSVALTSIEEADDPRRKSRVLAELEEAYARLQAALEAPLRPLARKAHAPPPPLPEPPPPDFPLDGPGLRRMRESLGLTPDDIFAQLKFRHQLLAALEEERFADLPQETYLRVHLKNLAACLRLPTAKVLADYLVRYQDWKKERP